MHFVFCRQCEKSFLCSEQLHINPHWWHDMQFLCDILIWRICDTWPIRVTLQRPLLTCYMFVEDDWGCGDIIHSIVLCVCVRADCGHDNDDDECFHFALDCFGRWETPVDGDTWYFYWFFISCAVIILNCVNQWMQWVHCAVINHKMWNVFWNTSLFLHCREWNVIREVNNVEWSEWH